MASLSLKHIYKVYDNGKEGVKAVNDFCMEIEDKEFIVFVGPSGCGKSTTLRMIAGLEEITAGELMIGDEVVNDVEPKDRNIAMVFQNYALYPHMTVRENMAFALKLRKDMSKEEIDARVNEAARILDIEQFLERKPRALSGGQRQRVSLGRAIVRDPKVFLLDEPLSNLDAKLRAQMRTEITKLHKKLATTFIYVTHDQVEAMTMGTRIVVMKLGVVQQIDTPQNLYKYPGNKFVAGFIGTPQMNFFDATLKKVEGGKVAITFANDRTILVPEESVLKTDAKYFDGETVVTFGIRPEDIHFDADFVAAHQDSAITCKTSIIEALGSETIVYCELDEENADAIRESKSRLVLKVDPKIAIGRDQEITIAIDPTCIHLFDNETEKSIIPRIPEHNLVDGVVSNGNLNIYGKSIALPRALNTADDDYVVNIPTDAFVFNGDSLAKTVIAEEKNVYETLPVGEKYVKTQLTNVVTNYTVEEFAAYDVKPSEVFKAKVAFIENIGKTKLVCLDINGNKAFAIAPDYIDENCQEVSVAIDWKKVSLTGANGNVEALNLTNEIGAKLVKELVGRKEYNFTLNVGDVNAYVTTFVQDKLFNAAGRKVFDIDLTLDFGIYDVMIAEEGISGIVKTVLDYGAEKVAVVDVNGKAINVYAGNNDLSEGQEVKLALNIPALGIVETYRGIRII